jgi:hypothetical protein
LPLESALLVTPKRPLGAYFREWHSYISAFIAPMMLFFASSGALQIFNLHESHGGYVAPAIIRATARIHKDQEAGTEPARRFEDRVPGGVQPPFGSRRGEGPGGGEGRTWSTPTLFLKWLFFLEACALVITTLLGIWIGVVHAKRQRTIIALLVAGTLLPSILILWQIKGGSS